MAGLEGIAQDCLPFFVFALRLLCNKS